MASYLWFQASKTSTTALDSSDDNHPYLPTLQPVTLILFWKTAPNTSWYPKGRANQAAGPTLWQPLPSLPTRQPPLILPRSYPATVPTRQAPPFPERKAYLPGNRAPYPASTPISKKRGKPTYPANCPLPGKHPPLLSQEGATYPATSTKIKVFAIPTLWICSPTRQPGSYAPHGPPMPRARKWLRSEHIPTKTLPTQQQKTFFGQKPTKTCPVRATRQRAGGAQLQ